MPDHVHVLAAPTEDREAKLGNLSAALKRWIRQELKATWQWQPGSFDRLLRSTESLTDKWLYIRENPVRAGLVERSEDWPYSLGFQDDPCRNCRAGASPAAVDGKPRPRQAMRLPYNPICIR